MKKAIGLLFFGMFSVCACQKDSVPGSVSEPAGTAVDVDGFPASVRKVFVLNEGGMGANNATLDFLRISDGTYVTGAFKKMNPAVAGGLGDVGNAIAVHGDEVWVVVNNSGIVEVVSAKDEREIAAVPVPSPRGIAFDDRYAYVTSWAGAFADGGFDADGGYSVTDSANPKGRVYRIDLSSKKITGSVEVGWQPEGIACSAGKIYVANSGGIASQLPPLYAYDNTVSIIDAAAFTVVRTVEVADNLKYVFAGTDGCVYVTASGDYGAAHSAVYLLERTGSGSMTDGATGVRKISDYVTVCAFRDDVLYFLGTESEFDWSVTTHEYKGCKVRGGQESEWDFPVEANTLYGLCALDDHTFLVGDAGDYFNPGSVICYQDGSRRWRVAAGVCPGHFAIWE